MAEPVSKSLQIAGLQQDELRRLRARVKALETMVGTPEKRDGIIVEAIGDTMRMIRQDFEDRLTTLENARVKFCGVHEHGVTYRPSSLVTRSGSLWCSLRETRETPGQSSDWQLAVKRGGST